MNAEQTLSKINAIVNKHGLNTMLHKDEEYKSLIQELKEDIALAEQKKSGKPNRFKAALRFAKYCQKKFADSKRGFAGAWVHDGKQYITDTHAIICYDEPMDGLPEAGEAAPPSSLRELFKYDSNLPVTLPSLAELKTELKVAKAEGRLDEHRPTKIDGHYYNMEYVIKLIEMVEPKEAYFSRNGKYPLLVLIGEGAQGVLCGVRLKNQQQAS